MAINNCSFSPTLEIPAEFPTRCVLAKLNTKPRNYSYPRRLGTIKDKTGNKTDK